MSKSAKKTAKKQTRRAAAPAAKPAAFAPGQRVRVKFGDYGNTRGTVESSTPNGASVVLDNQPRQGAMLFPADNLQAL